MYTLYRNSHKLRFIKDCRRYIVSLRTFFLNLQLKHYRNMPHSSLYPVCFRSDAVIACDLWKKRFKVGACISAAMVVEAAFSYKQVFQHPETCQTLGNTCNSKERQFAKHTSLFPVLFFKRRFKEVKSRSQHIQTHFT